MSSDSNHFLFLSSTDPGRIEDSLCLQVFSIRKSLLTYAFMLLVSYFYLPLHAFGKIGRRFSGLTNDNRDRGRCISLALIL